MNNDHYVYLHKRKDNGEVFYIGHGRLDRANTKNNRNLKWHTIVKDSGGFYVEYLARNLTKSQAVTLEKIKLESPESGWGLVNVSAGHENLALDKNFLETYLVYDESSPSCLRWKKRFTNNTNKDLVSGSLVNGYWIVCINRKRYRAHRIVCVLHDKYLDEHLVVNHIDNNPSNNVITNLEIVTQANNSRKTSRNTNPLNTGVIFSEVDNKYKYWTAYVYDLNSKRYSRSFNCNKYGYDRAKQLAEQWRKEQLCILNSQGAEYNVK